MRASLHTRTSAPSRGQARFHQTSRTIPSVHRGRQLCSAVTSSSDDGTGPSTSERAGALLMGGVLAASMVFGSFSPALALDDKLVERAVQDYSALTPTQQNSLKELENIRQKYRMRRSTDGRLQLRSQRGDWFSIRLDMEVAGSMLLRDTKGNVFAIQTDALQQIDLSDDLVALMMFADGDWEKQMSPVEYVDEGGKVLQLKLEEKEFREVVGILKEIQEEAQG